MIIEAFLVQLNLGNNLPSILCRLLTPKHVYSQNFLLITCISIVYRRSEVSLQFLKHWLKILIWFFQNKLVILLQTERNVSWKKEISLGWKYTVILGEMKATMSDLSWRCQNTEGELYEKIWNFPDFPRDSPRLQEGLYYVWKNTLGFLVRKWRNKLWGKKKRNKKGSF